MTNSCTTNTNDASTEEAQHTSTSIPHVHEILVPPLNFSQVAPGIYRSGYPNRKNHHFLRKLNLKTIIHLSPDPISPENQKLFDSISQLKVYHIPLEGNKEPFMRMSRDDTMRVLKLILDTSNHPLLVHCNKGKHRVGCIVGILRKLQMWSITSIFDEYRRFAGGKVRLADQEFIELFETATLQALQN